MITADNIAQVLALDVANIDIADLAPLETKAELFGFVIAEARADGADEEREADLVELLARSVNLDPSTVRDVERTLRALGYRAASARLRQIAGRRKHDLKPLSPFP